MKPNVFVNRTLNMRKISHIGLDMDHTLIRYNTQNFEALVYQYVIDELIAYQGYPETLRTLKFNIERAIRGLVIDCQQGNILKLNRFGAIRTSFHGTQPIHHQEQKRIYHSKYVDLNDSNYIAVDTSFSIAFCVLYGQIIDLKDQSTDAWPSYQVMAHDVLKAVDTVHAKGDLKKHIRENLATFVYQDPDIVAGLQHYLDHGKKIFILTNSDYAYTQVLLDYALTPFLKPGQHWRSLFEYIITASNKPRFFYDNLSFLSVDPHTGNLQNIRHAITPGVYQGGNATQFTHDLALSGDEILYIGDHIYGDILRLKKACNWRTALVVDDLGHELKAQTETRSLEQNITQAMIKKTALEEERLYASAKEPLTHDLEQLDHRLTQWLEAKKTHYNPYWESPFRAGAEETYFTYQVERYACIYMEKLADLFAHPPMTYFRASKRSLPHEQTLME